MKCKCGKEIEQIEPNGTVLDGLIDKFQPTMCDECLEAAEIEKKERERSQALQRIRGSWPRLAKDCNIPYIYREADLDTMVSDKYNSLPIKVARGYKRGFLVLTGEVGRGKTYLACATLKKHMLSAPGLKGLFARMVDVLDDIKQGYLQNDMAALNRYKSVGCLVLDDLGAERDDLAWNKEIVYNLIDHRHTQGLCTIITTNLKHCDEKIRSRLSTGLIVEMKGQDRRQGNKETTNGKGETK